MALHRRRDHLRRPMGGRRVDQPYFFRLFGRRRRSKAALAASPGVLALMCRLVFSTRSFATAPAAILFVPTVSGRVKKPRHRWIAVRITLPGYHGNRDYRPSALDRGQAITVLHLSGLRLGATTTLPMP